MEPINLAAKLDIFPADASRWNDIESLFGSRGACGGCWCMYWRQTHSEFELLKGDANRQLLSGLVKKGEQVGLIAYLDGTPAGWCALAPRGDYPRLARSRILKPVDDQPVWSVVCFFVARPFRHSGLTVALLKSAVGYVAQHGAGILEGYPVESKVGKLPDPFIYTGTVSAFLQAGFHEVARRSETRPVMRYEIETGR